MEKIWNFIHSDYTDGEIEAFRQGMKNYLSTPLTRLMASRVGLSVDAARDFLRPDLKKLHDPFLFNDMEKAVSRLEKAVDGGEKILIYGDYDVDGTTAVALVYSFLREFCPNLIYYIPDRYSEGYGVSFKGVDYAFAEGCTLIVSLDCGIKDNARIEYAGYKGIDFIVCDHHTPGCDLPKAAAVLDAKRQDNTYPFDELSGCGVGFKFMQAFCLRRGIPFEKLLKYIDLTAVSIGSDIVPIVDENRILAYYGLKKLNASPLVCFQALKKEAGLDGREMTLTDSVFNIGPRINAAGRIHSGRDAVRLLVTEDIQEAEKFAAEISEYNQKRKDLDRGITGEALKMLSGTEDKTSTVVYGENWHRGVVGIVASRLTETYFRPTVVFSKTDGVLTGSARSVSDFNLYEAIDNCRKHLTAFGGHKFAAGLSMKFENFPAFKEDFEKYVSGHITEHQRRPEIKIEQELDFKSITQDFYARLKEFEPFGPQNPEPVFSTSGVVDTGSRPVGRDNKHLRLEISDSQCCIKTGIAFGMGSLIDKIRSGKPFDVCYTLDLNEFNGIKTVQLAVKDIRF